MQFVSIVKAYNSFQNLRIIMIGSQTEEPIVTIQEGTLKGTIGQNFDGENFLKFFGFPYAQPPLNELRFKPPQPIDPWEGIKNATEVGSACISRDDFTHQIVGSEDCLYLNVYTRKLPSSNTTLRPVMVYIHGGGFKLGSSRPGIYGPEFLMMKDIVLVTLNYRLGALGFLNVEDSDVTGNMGLKDQNLALKWVQRNIKNFNGDPGNVTIFGESAGSASVHAHILAPASKGLFHKAILQSGCALNPWAWGRTDIAMELANNLGKSVKTEKEALDILKEVPALELFAAQEKIFDVLYPKFRRPIGLVLEKPSESAFLTKDPRDIIKEGSYNQVPVMIGYTDTEGMLIELFQTFGLDRLDYEIENIVPYELNVAKESTECNKIIEILENLYSGGPKENHYNELTDSCFLAGITELLLSYLETSKNPSYFYRMSISSDLNWFKRILQMLDQPGACHADDLGYLWHSELTPEVKPGSLQDKSVRTFVELWTNFAEYGNPTPNDKLNISWQPFESKENMNVLDIGENLQIKDFPERKRMKVWWDIYKAWPPQRRS